MPQVCSAVISTNSGFFDKSKMLITFFKENDDVQLFIFFYVLFSVYIETINCVNFKKKWKNGDVLTFLISSMFI